MTPGSSYQPSDPTKDTTITYTADKQQGSVSYVDDTTRKTLKTDSISGTTGSKSSYSTSGSIADYKKQGYELVTDGYPADLTFDNDDTTDQNFTVHLKHRLTPVNPTVHRHLERQSIQTNQKDHSGQLAPTMIRRSTRRLAMLIRMET